VDENGTITIDPVGNDPDGDDLTVTVGDPSHGTVERDQDGNLVYTPDEGFCGTDAIPVTFTDPDGESYTISVEVTVECVNDAPIAADDAFTTTEDTSLVLDPTDNDLDPDLVGELAVRFVGEPDHGDVRLTPNGDVRYTPARDFCGTDEFAYRAVDDKGLASDGTAKVTVEVRCVNDAPRAVRDSFARMVPDSGKVKVRARGILRNDVDPDSKLRAKLVKAPKRGVLKLRKNGGFTYRIPKGASPTSWVTFTYRACDRKSCSPTRKVTLHLR
jgi:hypothetical protein